MPLKLFSASTKQEKNKACLLLNKILASFAFVLFSVYAFADQGSVHLRDLAFSQSPQNIVKIQKIYELSHSSDDFGGLSGMVMDEKGHFIIINDQGSLFELVPKFNDQNILTALKFQDQVALNDEKGILKSRKKDRDAESLTLTKSGDLYVAFERNNRIHKIEPSTGALGEEIAFPTTEKAFQRNKGIEALELTHNGNWIAIEEGSVQIGESRVFLKSSEQSDWQITTLPHIDQYRPTGLAQLPNQQNMILLERYFSPPVDVRARLYLFDPVKRERIGRLGEFRSPNPIDNFEAVTARQLSDGDYQIFILADDNFNLVQRTLLMQLSYQP